MRDPHNPHRSKGSGRTIHCDGCFPAKQQFELPKTSEKDLEYQDEWLRHNKALKQILGGSPVLEHF
jgi:hypothetical protein